MRVSLRLKCSSDHVVTSRWEKVKKTWVDCVIWTKTNNMSWGEKQRADTGLKLSFWYSVAVLTYLFAGFVSMAMRLVWGPFLEFTRKWRLQPLTVLTLPYLVFNCLFLLHCVRLLTNFQNRTVWWRREVISVYGGSTTAQKFWNLQFFLVVFVTVVIHPGIPDLQRVLWPDSSEASWLFRRLSVCFFLLSFFFCLSFPRNQLPILYL